jgi:hypothetical protein
MKYVAEMVLGAMTRVYIPSFAKIGSGIQNLMGGGEFEITREQDGDRISLI